MLFALLVLAFFVPVQPCSSSSTRVQSCTWWLKRAVLFVGLFFLSFFSSFLFLSITCLSSHSPTHRKKRRLEFDLPLFKHGCVDLVGKKRNYKISVHSGQVVQILSPLLSLLSFTPLLSLHSLPESLGVEGFVHLSPLGFFPPFRGPDSQKVNA